MIIKKIYVFVGVLVLGLILIIIYLYNDNKRIKDKDTQKEKNITSDVPNSLENKKKIKNIPFTALFTGVNLDSYLEEDIKYTPKRKEKINSPIIQSSASSPSPIPRIKSNDIISSPSPILFIKDELIQIVPQKEEKIVEVQTQVQVQQQIHVQVQTQKNNENVLNSLQVENEFRNLSFDSLLNELHYKIKTNTLDQYALYCLVTPFKHRNLTLKERYHLIDIAYPYIIEWAKEEKKKAMSVGKMTSIPEEYVRLLLLMYYGVYFPNTRPNFLKNPESKRNLEYDCYNSFYKIAIERNGEQHYIYPHKYNPTEEKTIEQVRRDKYKKDVSDALGIFLITFNYKIQNDNLNKALYDIFEEYPQISPINFVQVLESARKITEKTVASVPSLKDDIDYNCNYEWLESITK